MSILKVNPVLLQTGRQTASPILTDSLRSAWNVSHEYDSFKSELASAGETCEYRSSYADFQLSAEVARKHRDQTHTRPTGTQMRASGRQHLTDSAVCGAERWVCIMCCSLFLNPSSKSAISHQCARMRIQSRQC
jgi:hypothetical protein